jgi:tRNA A-37 threonylcarbamoyl transferase component Bud32
MGRAPEDLRAAADRAERAGDMVAAAAALRSVVERDPDDARARLRLARALTFAGQREAARRALEPLDDPARAAPGVDPARAAPGVDPARAALGVDPARAAPAGLAAEVNRAFAALEEADGAPAEAARRWERVLADDIDDTEARTRLDVLRPEAPAPLAGATETLVSPEGTTALRYRLRHELGRGATATVYLATDEALGIDVALKILHPQLAGAARADARRRFFAEGRVAAGLRHPGVVAIYDLDEPTRLLAMEHVPGGTLRARLASHRGAPLPGAELAAAAASLLEALAYVHGRGVAHGDLKPSNLLLRAPGDVVLADFGAAELRADAGAVADAPGGTPQYLAPERLRGARPSPASDLYAAGAVLWEMAAGRPLRTHADLLGGGALAIPPLPASARDVLGPRLAAAVTALVDATPSSRPASARDLLATLA